MTLVIVFDKMEPSELSFNGKYNLPKLNLDIFTEFSHFSNTKLTTILQHKSFVIAMVRSSWYFQPFTPYFWSTTIHFKQFFASFSLFWCLEKLWCCVLCARYMRHSVPFYGRWVGREHRFSFGIISEAYFCNNWLPNLQHNLRENVTWKIL